MKRPLGILPLLALLLMPACAQIEKMRTTAPRMDSAAGMYDRASIVYRIDAGKMSEPVALARIDGQLVSYEERASAPLPKCSTGTLTVRYPHPDGRRDVALAELVITAKISDATLSPGERAKKSWLPSWIPVEHKEELAYESWKFDLPKPELDQAMSQLHEGGFFTVAKATVIGIDIEASLDNFERHKSWRQVPEIEAIMQHVRRSGTLVSYRRGPEIVKPAAVQTTSVDAYRQLTAQDQRTPSAQPVAAPKQPTFFGLAAPSGPGGTGTMQFARLPGDTSVR